MFDGIAAEAMKMLTLLGQFVFTRRNQYSTWIGYGFWLSLHPKCYHECYTMLQSWDLLVLNSLVPKKMEVLRFLISKCDDRLQEISAVQNVDLNRQKLFTFFAVLNWQYDN